MDQIDPATGTVTKTVQVGGRPDAIAVGPDAVGWRELKTAPLPASTRPPASQAAQCPSVLGLGIGITPGAVWVANSPDLTVNNIHR